MKKVSVIIVLLLTVTRCYAMEYNPDDRAKALIGFKKSINQRIDLLRMQIDDEFKKFQDQLDGTAHVTQKNKKRKSEAPVKRKKKVKLVKDTSGKKERDPFEGLWDVEYARQVADLDNKIAALKKLPKSTETDKKIEELEASRDHLFRWSTVVC